MSRVEGTKTWMGRHPKNKRPVIVLEGPEGVGRAVVYADDPLRGSVEDAAEIWSTADGPQDDASPGGEHDPWDCSQPIAVAAHEDWRARTA